MTMQLLAAGQRENGTVCLLQWRQTRITASGKFEGEKWRSHGCIAQHCHEPKREVTPPTRVEAGAKDRLPRAPSQEVNASNDRSSEGGLEE